MKANEATDTKYEAGDGEESNLPGGEDIDLLCGLGGRLGGWLGRRRRGRVLRLRNARVAVRCEGVAGVASALVVVV